MQTQLQLQGWVLRKIWALLGEDLREVAPRYRPLNKVLTQTTCLEGNRQWLHHLQLQVGTARLGLQWEVLGRHQLPLRQWRVSNRPLRLQRRRRQFLKVPRRLRRQHLQLRARRDRPITTVSKGEVPHLPTLRRFIHGWRECTSDRVSTQLFIWYDSPHFSSSVRVVIYFGPRLVISGFSHIISHVFRQSDCKHVGLQN